MFSNCSSLEKLNVSNFRIGNNINYMNWMFFECSNLKKLIYSDEIILLLFKNK